MNSNNKLISLNTPIKIITFKQITPLLQYPAIIDLMREALIAQSQGLCDTPHPMHLDIPAENAEVHVKTSYRNGGLYFVLRLASTFPQNMARGLSTGNGMMLLTSAQTGQALAIFADNGHLTDVRTAAVSAMVAKELNRNDSVMGIIGTGIQAKLQAQMHSQILPLKHICIWGRSKDRAEQYCLEMKSILPEVQVHIADSPETVAKNSKLIVTTTASKSPLLFLKDILPGTHISAVGSDGPHKQELDANILKSAELLLVDSKQQCQKLGELQHALEVQDKAIEIGQFCSQNTKPIDKKNITVSDFTGLGVEDLYIAEYCYHKINS